MPIIVTPSKGLARLVFNDGVLNVVKTGAPTRGPIVGIIAGAITAKQHEGRPFHHWWGGHVTADDQPLTNSLKMLRLNTLEGGCKSPRGIVHAIPKAGTSSATAGVYCMDGTLNAWPTASFTQQYPEQLIPIDVSPDTSAESAFPSGFADENVMGSDSLIMVNGCLYESTVIGASPDVVVQPTGFAPGADILADQTNSLSTDARLTDRFQHVWQNRRPCAQWSCQAPNFCDFTESSQDFRFYGDQTVGDGGTAPAVDGPGDTLFGGTYAGAGRRNTIRVYTWVYAAMSGTTDNGEIAIANKDTTNTMQPFVQIGGAGMISGNTFQWYPATGGGFDPATSPFFETPTNQTFDRVLLGARSTGATDTVRMAGWMMAIYHSVA